MTRLPLLFLAGSLFLGVSAPLEAQGALQIELNLEATTKTLDERFRSGGISIEMTPSEAAGEPLKALCLPARPCSVELRTGTKWSVTVREDALWSPAIEVGPIEAGKDVTLSVPVFPAAKVRGKFISNDGPERLPRTAEARISWPPVTASERSPPKVLATQDFQVEEGGEFSFSVPAVSMDLRLWAPSFAPFYFWAVQVSAASPRNLDRLELFAGASLMGWIETEGVAPKDVRPKLRLLPVAQGLTEGGETQKRLAIEGTSDPSGFFQLTGIPAGVYVLAASLEGFGEGRSPARVFLEGEESELLQPLVLRPPAILEVNLQPRTDAYGQPWLLRLTQEVPQTTGFWETVAEGAPGEEGPWRSGPLSSGGYGLEVSDSQGSIWVREELELATGVQPIFVEVPLIPVEGRVRYGDDPVEGRLWFGGKHRVPKIAVELDVVGAFAGYLPKEGKWALDLESADGVLEQAIDPVEVEVSAGQGVARLEIQLPNTELAVRVVDEAGESVAGAELVVVGHQDEKPRREALARTRDDGTFTFRGLAAGELRLQARKAGTESDWLRILLQEEIHPPELILPLRKLSKLSGRVTKNGVGVFGAAVFVRMDRMPIRRTSVTEADGSFELKLPPGPATLAVSAPGHGFLLLPLMLAQEPSTPIEIILSPQSGRLILDLREVLASGMGFNDLTLVATNSNGELSLSFRELVAGLGVPSGDSPEPILEIPAVEPGNWSLCFGSSPCASGHLAPGGRLELDPRPQTKAAISPTP